MLEDFNGLHMQSRVVATNHGQDLGFLEENAMISVSKCLLSHYRLLRLPQTTTGVVFTNAGTDTALHSADVHLLARARHSKP